MDLETCGSLRQCGPTSRGHINFHTIRAGHMVITTTRASQQADRNFFMLGISQGIHIGFVGSHSLLKSARTNLGGALQHPKVVEKYLSTELSQLAHLTKLLFLRLSRFGVILKGHQPDKWRLILDLRYS